MDTLAGNRDHPHRTLYTLDNFCLEAILSSHPSITDDVVITLINSPMTLSRTRGPLTWPRSWRRSLGMKSGSRGKGPAKEKVMRLFDLLEAPKERRRLAQLLEEDEQRRSVEDETVKLVVLSLRRSWRDSISVSISLYTSGKRFVKHHHRGSL